MTLSDPATMSTTQLDPAIPVDTAKPWDAELARVRARFPKAQDTVVFCVHAIEQDPDINVAVNTEIAKRREQGVRVRCMSVSHALVLAPAILPHCQAYHGCSRSGIRRLVALSRGRPVS